MDKHEALSPQAEPMEMANDFEQSGPGADDGSEPLYSEDDAIGPDEGGQYRFSRKLSVLSEPAGVRSSAVGALRNHLSQQHLRLGRRALAICSVGNNVNRTEVSANLAIASAQSGAATVLLDTNFREPELDNFFIPPGPQLGLSEYLRGDVSDPAAILRTSVVDNLTVVHAGAAFDDPQALLAGDRFEVLVANLMRNFDFVLADCPAASMSADARRIASVMRYALIVVKRDVTYVDDVKRLIQELNSDRVSVVGTFLNVS